jgi:hypothetical protein
MKYEECTRKYIGQIGHKLKDRFKEYNWAIKN